MKYSPPFVISNINVAPTAKYCANDYLHLQIIVSLKSRDDRSGMLRIKRIDIGTSIQ